MDNDNPAASEAGSVEETINLRHYWHIVLERRWLVLTAFICVIALCLIYIFRATRIYQADCRLEIDPEAPNVLNLRDAFAASDEDYLQTQYKNLQSRTLVASVIQQLHLDRIPRYAKALDKVRAVSQDITISPIRLSRLVDIKVDNPDPALAALMANTLATNFLQINLDQKMHQAMQTFSWLTNQADSLEKRVEQSDAALATYMESNKMPSLEDSQNTVLQSLKQAQNTYDLAQSQARDARKEAEEVKKLVQQGVDPEDLPSVLDDKLIQDMRNKLADAQATLQGLLERYKSKYPDVIKLRATIQGYQMSISNAAEDVYSSITNQAEIAEAKAESAKTDLAEKTKEAMRLRQMRTQYDVLQRKSSEDKSAYNMVLQGMRQVQLMANDKVQNMRITDAAVVPFRPVKPRILLTIVLGVFGGLGVGIGLAFFVNYLDDSIKSQDDVESYLRLPFLGYIPNIKSNSIVERDRQAHVLPQSSAAEAFRTVRAAVSLVPNADRLRILSVTSTIPGEGKSLVASNLAIVMAQIGHKTLLVDSDLRRPSVHKAFQLQSPMGLSTYLSGTVDTVEELVHTTDIPNLDIICSGAIPALPSELVGSPRMRKFLEEVGRRYDRVILDCPPVSAVSDPLVVASMSNGVLFVAKFNKVRREHARKSVQRLQDAGIHIVGVALNDIDFEGKESYYYSYYYYQNRYYSSHYQNHAAGEEAQEEPTATKKG